MKYVVLALMFMCSMVQAKVKYHVQCVDISGGYTVKYKSSIVKHASQGKYGTIIFLNNNTIIHHNPATLCKIIRK